MYIHVYTYYKLIFKIYLYITHTDIYDINLGIVAFDSHVMLTHKQVLQLQSTRYEMPAYSCELDTNISFI